MRRAIWAVVDLFYEDPWLLGGVVAGVVLAALGGRVSTWLGGLLLVAAVLAGLYASLRRGA